jgi:hypothetical protein
MTRPGFIDYKGTNIAFAGLANDDYEIRSVTVSGDVRDSGAVNTDDPRAGLCLEQDSTTGKYVAFASDHDSLVVLAEPLYDLADYGDTVARVFLRGTFKQGSVIEPATVTWSSAQRFIILPEY